MNTRNICRCRKESDVNISRCGCGSVSQAPRRETTSNNFKLSCHCSDGPQEMRGVSDAYNTQNYDTIVDVDAPDEERWAETEATLCDIDEDLERATQEELQLMQDSLGPAADQYHVIESLVDTGVSDEVNRRGMLKKKGPCYYKEELGNNNDQEMRYYHEVEQMIQEEAEDVDIAQRLEILEFENRLKDETPDAQGHKMPSKSKAYNLRRQLRDMHKQTKPNTIAEGDEPDEIQPEVAAAMMHTEERGLHLGDAPQHMFTYLFKGRPNNDGSSVDILPGDPTQVVPVKLQPQAGPNVDLDGTGSMQQPNTELYSETVGREAAAPSNTSVTSSNQLGQSSVDYFLEPRAPAYFTRVQLRGSVPPAWFPGFFEALPLTSDGVRLVDSPSGVFQQAWQFVQPCRFEPDNVFMPEDPSTDLEQQEEICA